MQKISPFLWFDNKAEEAANFYTTVFKDGKIISTMPGPSGVMAVTFVVDGQELTAFNGGPEFKFTEAVSFFVRCETQEEVDELWEKLTANGGEESQCGWLKDKYGLSWQIVPNRLGELTSDPDQAKAARVVQAMLQMKKIIIKDLEAAYRGE